MSIQCMMGGLHCAMCSGCSTTFPGRGSPSCVHCRVWSKVFGEVASL